MKTRALLLAGCCALVMTACGGKDATSTGDMGAMSTEKGSEVMSEATVVNTFEKTPEEEISELREKMEPVIAMTHYEMSDGTWKTDEHGYKYRLELTGTMPNAEAESTFIVLSNSRDITFKQAYMASGISSNTEDYFKPENAVIVSMK